MFSVKQRVKSDAFATVDHSILKNKSVSIIVHKSQEHSSLSRRRVKVYKFYVNHNKVEV